MMDQGSELIQPFNPTKTVFNETGTSGGLSYAGYDCHLTDVEGGFDNKDKHFKRTLYRELPPHQFILGVTLEKFKIPENMMGFVHNKSTDARNGLLQVTGVLEPGWEGYLTLEMFNMHPKDSYRLIEGQPIAQIIFHQIDQTVTSPYSGKYQDQSSTPTNALMEKTING